MLTFSETRESNMSLSPCDWCYEPAPAQWKINEPASLDGVAYACTMHGTEWYPHLFPESDVTPIECIVAEITGRVSLDKIGDHDGHVPEWIIEKRREDAYHQPTGTRQRPWYPLLNHRPGLRANDLVSLASALFVLALEGGTAHVVGTVNQD